MSDDQRWVDEVVFYRNLAIMHGAGPNEMTNDWDRRIAEAGISIEPSEGPHRDYESADARREVMDIWDTNERLEAEIAQLREIERLAKEVVDVLWGSEQRSWRVVEELAQALEGAQR